VELLNLFGAKATSKVADLPGAYLHCVMRFITFWCNSTAPQVRASNSYCHVGVGYSGVFKQVVSQICVHKKNFKFSCGTGAVGRYVSHVRLSVGKLDTGGQTVCRSL
jgi:hypothetical protein